MNYKVALLLGMLLLAVPARGQQPRLACPLSYDPVVDPHSGLPFYNECLARLQLPSETNVVRRAALEQQAAAAAAAGARRLRAAAPSRPSAADYLKLLPKPAAGAETGDGVFVDTDVINMYAAEGFVYVGRPGFLNPAAGAAAAAAIDADTDTPAAAAGGSAPSSPSSPAPLSMDGSRVSLRITHPRGDMYVKIWSAQELQQLTARHTATASTAFTASTAALAQPNIPQLGHEDESDGDDGDLSHGTAALAAAAAATTTAAASLESRQQRSARRLLASAGGNGKGNGSAAGPTRSEVLLSKLSYPYSAVSYINITRYNADSTWCTGVMAGPTSRLVLTAAHCVYDFDTTTGTGRGYQQAFVVVPGQVRDATTNTIQTPYGRVSTNLAEVMAQWMLKGNFDFDIGLIRLAVHATLAGRAPGSMGFNYSCGTKSFSLLSAGYPGDKAPLGSLWSQNLTASASQCSGSVAQKVALSYSAGQDGSPLWSAGDNVIRFVASKAGVAVPIGPEYYSWIMDFTARTIITQVPLQLQGTSLSPALFFKCDPATRACAGSRKANATSWYFHPISVARKWALRYPNMNLCLTADSTANITATNATVAATLAPCNTDGRFTFPPNQLWNVDTFAAVGAIPAAKTDTEGYLSCEGEGQPLVVRGAAACARQEACIWKQVSA